MLTFDIPRWLNLNFTDPWTLDEVKPKFKRIPFLDPPRIFDST